MKDRKITIIFTFLALFYIDYGFGQLNLAAYGQVFTPIGKETSVYKDYGTGVGLEFSKQINRHSFSVSTQFLKLSGQYKNDQYLEYKQPDITAYLIDVGYSYNLFADLWGSVKVGPTFFSRPDQVLGGNILLGPQYKIKSFGIGVYLNHLMRKGYMNMVSLQVSYNLF